MNHRTSYELVAFECEKLFKTIPTLETYDEYLSLLEAFGWTRQDFDNEMLKRISGGWNNQCLN